MTLSTRHSLTDAQFQALGAAVEAAVVRSAETLSEMSGVPVAISAAIDIVPLAEVPVVLPGADPSGAPNPKFARSALPALVMLMQGAGAVRESLEAAGVSTVATELGGNRGRSVWFDPREGGQIRVRAVGSTERYL